MKYYRTGIVIADTARSTEMFPFGKSSAIKELQEPASGRCEPSAELRALASAFVDSTLGLPLQHFIFFLPPKRAAGRGLLKPKFQFAQSSIRLFQGMVENAELLTRREISSWSDALLRKL